MKLVVTLSAAALAATSLAVAPTAPAAGHSRGAAAAPHGMPTALSAPLGADRPRTAAHPGTSATVASRPTATAATITTITTGGFGGTVLLSRSGRVAYNVTVDTQTGRYHGFTWTTAGVTDLGDLTGNNSGYSFVWAINDSGAIAGGASGADGRSHAFLWTATEGMRDLGSVAGLGGAATAINNRGDVAGVWFTTGGENRGFLWTAHDGMQDLGTLGSGDVDPRSINDHDVIVGISTAATGSLKAFRWSRSAGMQDLGRDAASAGFIGSMGALGVNDHGDVTGFGYNTPYTLHTFRWTERSGLRDIGALPGTSTSAPTGIDAAGDIVGNSDAHAFVWTKRDGMRDLLNGAAGTVNAISGKGWVAGTADAAGGTSQAFRWSRRLGVQYLPTNGAPVSRGLASNDRGQVVGVLQSADGSQQLVLWTA